MALTPEVAVDVIKAICCLHNFLMLRNASQDNITKYCSETFVDREVIIPAEKPGDEDKVELIPGQWRDIAKGDSGSVPLELPKSSRPKRVAERLREDFAKFFETPIGHAAASWQYIAINAGKVRVNKSELITSEVNESGFN